MQAAKDGKGTFVKYVPGTFRALANKDNDYLVDRAAQKAGKTFSGVEGIAMQDQSLQESMGPIVDRTKENLVGTDNGIIMARHSLMRAAKALADKGTLPPGRDPEQQMIRSIAVVLPRDAALQGRRRRAVPRRPRQEAPDGVKGVRPSGSDTNTQTWREVSDPEGLTLTQRRSA